MSSELILSDLSEHFRNILHVWMFDFSALPELLVRLLAILYLAILGASSSMARK